MSETSVRCAVNGFPIHPMMWGVAADECQVTHKSLMSPLETPRLESDEGTGETPDRSLVGQPWHSLELTTGFEAATHLTPSYRRCMFGYPLIPADLLVCSSALMVAPS